MITIKYIDNHFKVNGYTPRHSFKGLKAACNKLARETKLDAVKLFHLLIENQPIAEAYTHSYNFHTANGRHLIDTLQNYYYQAVR